MCRKKDLVIKNFIRKLFLIYYNLMNKFCQLFKYKKLFLHKSIKVGYNFTSNEKQEESIKFVKLDNLKGFGKKFSDEEMKKYLDPFGFLTPNECKFIL
jgi:hypothetical protein